jgi:HD-like signal output (HDOD) protein
MTNTLAHWIKAFSDCEIPVLHESKCKIHDLQENEEDITVTVLAEIARQDPGFSINLLRRASSSRRKEITTLSHAISLIGIPFVIKMLSDLPTLEKVLDEKSLSSILNEYSRQYQTAFMAREWSILRKESENQEIFTAALNRGFIRFILYFIDSDKAHKLEKIYLTPDDNHKTKEKELLGNNVDEIAQAIAKHWNLPELIRENYSGKHHNPKITGIRLVAELLCQIYSHSSIHYPEELMIRIAEYIRIPASQTPGKINQIIVNAIRHSQQHLPHHSLLLMIMSYPSSIKKETIEIKTKNKSSKNTIFPDCIKLLRSNKSTKPARELIQLTIKAMKDGIGFSRVIFMPFDKNEKCLSVKFQSLDNNLPDLKQLKISIELNKLFRQLLKKEQTLCINSKNQHKFIERLPNALRPMKSSATIIVNSFYVNNKVAGCFYVDHGQTNKQLTTSELQSFKLICTELKTAIESTLIKNNPVKKVA